MRSNLNPNAPAYQRLNPVDLRTLFITFSYGYPLEEYQLYDYFNSWFPNCVESVYVHRVRGKPPLFGKVTFTDATFPVHVLEGRYQASLCVDGIHCFCKMYVPQRSRAGRRS